jgi:LmbE family N-acetylglucosaminyl deacetylase
VLKKQVNKANKILGVKKTIVFDFPDNRFDTVSLLDIVKAIEKVKKEINPNIVFTHHCGDLNIDHRITFNAVLTAFRPLKEETVKEIYSFEVPSSTEWNVSSSTCFVPNYFIDVSGSFKTKIRAMKEYKSEIRDFPHPRSPEAIKINAKRRGLQVGLELSEAFEIVRLIR